MRNNPEPLVDHLNPLKEDYLNLLSQNAELKSDLEKELFYHKNLFKQWKELNEAVALKDREIDQLKTVSKKGFYRSAFYGLLAMILLLAAINTYFLLFPVKVQNQTLSVSPAPVVDTLPVTNVPAREFTVAHKPVDTAGRDANKPVIKDTAASREVVSKQPVAQTAAHSAEEEAAEKTAITTPEKPDVNKVDTAAGDKKADQNSSDSTTSKNGSPGLYKVKSKAYFYDSPDESSRRNAFIVDWNNSYATLTALDDKNGFIYVIFKNHLGQESKGWLRKIDLNPI